MESLFFELNEIARANSTMTGLQREMLRMTLEANPGVTLGAAVQDVFDYLKVKLKKGRLEAICTRLVQEHQRDQVDDQEPSALPGEPPRPKIKQAGPFGKELIKWIEEMQAADRLLVAVGFDVEKARRIYIEQDYLVTDTICKLFLEDRWNAALVGLQAAAAPWMGGKKGGAGGEVEMFDLSDQSEDNPGWAELAKFFGSG